VKLLRLLHKLSFDLVFLAGCAVFVYGLSLAWLPLGFIVGGIVLAAIAFFAGYQHRFQDAQRAESEE
jgi:hypothetical protein